MAEKQYPKIKPQKPEPQWVLHRCSECGKEYKAVGFGVMCPYTACVSKDRLRG